jgi:hypothetical protein
MRTITALQAMTASAIWHSAVKSAKRLVGLLARACPLIVGSSSVNWVKAAFVFARFVHVTIQHQGHKGLAIYLKACNIAVMRSTAGDGVKNSRSIGAAMARTRSGLPRVIPAGFRKRIREGDISVIRLFLGFFTLYRVLNYRGKISLKTITNPGVPLYGGFIEEWKAFCKVFFRYLLKFGIKKLRTDLVPIAHGSRAACIDTKMYSNPMGLSTPGLTQGREMIDVDSEGNPGYGCREEIWGYVPKFFLIMKSGPNSRKGRVNVGNIIYDILAWMWRPQELRNFVRYVAVTRSWVIFPRVIGDCISYLVSKHPILGWLTPGTSFLGALAIREEPGKMRVVAMVDSFTQWVLYPLHRLLFDKVLRLIPQDGTFDQIAPVKALLESKQADRDRRLWSFDLSAATDRIPVLLQEILLGFFMTPEAASYWRILLTGREYRVPPAVIKQDGWKRSSQGHPLDSVKYEVGQPMGAYSSWAMLALVHHCMVQYSAWKAGCRGWFALYAVLGDDLVIGDYQVAYQYIKLCKTIGVEINLAKSIISDNLSLEFAKRYFYKGVEVTPLPLLAIALGWLGIRDIPEIVAQVKSRTGRSLSLYLIGRYVSLGLRACSGLSSKLIRSMTRKQRAIVLLLLRPGALYGVPTLVHWYTLTRASGQRLSVDGAWEAIAQATRHRIDRFLKLNLRARLYKATVDFGIVRYMKKTLDSDDMAWFGMAEWWETQVVAPFKAPILERLDEVDLMIKQADKHIEAHDEESTALLLEAMEDLETQIAMVPKQVQFNRTEEETVRPGSDRFPRRVRAWNRISKKFHRAYQDAQHFN